MMYWTGDDWQTLLFALLAGVEAGALLAVATALRPRPWGTLTDIAAGLGMGFCLLRALWQGTEGRFRLYVPLLMLLGALLFRAGPQALARELWHSLRRRKKRDTITEP